MIRFRRPRALVPIGAVATAATLALSIAATPTGGHDHPFYEIVSPEWASAWPSEELWVAVLASEQRNV